LSHFIVGKPFVRLRQRKAHYTLTSERGVPKERP
jgi:hypothetical protein